MNPAGGGGGGASWMVWGCLHACMPTLSCCLPHPHFPLSAPAGRLPWLEEAEKQGCWHFRLV